MKGTVNVPGAAWWILAAILIPILQGWITATFPDASVWAWAPLAVGILGGLAKWIQWVLSQQKKPVDVPDGVAAAPAPQADPRNSWTWFLLG